MDCQDAKDWFIDAHTVDRSFPFSDDPPRDVNCVVVPFNKYCVTMTFDRIIINGEIEFPNGDKCKIQEIVKERSKFNPCDNPNYVDIKFKGFCQHCYNSN